ncbi:unnamed protein product, partial [Didymodactylos carnosus]
MALNSMVRQINAPRAQCSTCDESNGLHECDECHKRFCHRHLTVHKELLKKFDEQGTQRILQVKQKLIGIEKDSKSQRNNHPLMKKITEWELESTSKIHRIAEETRSKVQQILD